MKRAVIACAAAMLLLCGCAAGETSSANTDSVTEEASSSAAASSEVNSLPEEVQPIVVPEMPEMPQHLSQQQQVLEAAGDTFYKFTDSRYPVYANTQVSYYPTGEAFYKALLEEAARAEDFILLEYFIVSEGEMLDGLVDVLRERVDAGVEVRMLCDGFEQNKAFAEKMSLNGIDCRVFSGQEEISLNMRDHRKLAVIDGKTAFMGGVNISDEYINIDSPYGRWKDAAIQMRGEAVRSCTELFFEQWDNGGELSDCSEYLDKAQPVQAEGYVMPYGESPLDECNAAYDIYMELINSAEEYLYITAPYLNIGDELEDALCAAVKRGTEVIMIVPGIPDKYYMELIARPHYKTLVAAGVKIYRFEPGFIHSKVFICDDRIATVGSINLNNRSFYCDFECGAVLTETSCIADIKRDILDTLPECKLLTEKSIPDLTPAERTQAAFFSSFDNIL